MEIEMLLTNSYVLRLTKMMIYGSILFIYLILLVIEY